MKFQGITSIETFKAHITLELFFSGVNSIMSVHWRSVKKMFVANWTGNFSNSLEACSGPIWRQFFDCQEALCRGHFHVWKINKILKLVVVNQSKSEEEIKAKNTDQIYSNKTFDRD